MVVLPVGGGGLIAGMAAAIRMMSPDTLIIGVEPDGANSRAKFRIRQAGTLDSIDTIADSLGAPMPLQESMALARQNTDELVTIPDSLTADMMLLMRHTLNIVADSLYGVARNGARPAA